MGMAKLALRCCTVLHRAAEICFTLSPAGQQSMIHVHKLAQVLWCALVPRLCAGALPCSQIIAPSLHLL